MRFSEFIADGRVVLGEPDVQKSNALVKMATSQFTVVKSIPLTDESSSLVFVQSYECLRQMLEAISLLEGYKLYSHEAFTSYLLEKCEESLANHFDRFRKLRNGVNYYGKPVSLLVAKESLVRIGELITLLGQKYLSD